MNLILVGLRDPVCLFDGISDPAQIKIANCICSEFGDQLLVPKG